MFVNSTLLSVAILAQGFWKMHHWILLRFDKKQAALRRFIYMRFLYKPIFDILLLHYYIDCNRSLACLLRRCSICVFSTSLLPIYCYYTNISTVVVHQQACADILLPGYYIAFSRSWISIDICSRYLVVLFVEPPVLPEFHGKTARSKAISPPKIGRTTRSTMIPW